MNCSPCRSQANQTPLTPTPSQVRAKKRRVTTVTAFFTGLATAVGAGVSMAFSEGLSDTGDLTGRGNPFVRGGITGGGTFVGGVFHTFPFLITDYQVAIAVAVVVVACELVVLAALRTVFFRTSFGSSFVSVTLGGAIIAAVSSALGAAAS